jgi:hypothetical protein
LFVKLLAQLTKSVLALCSSLMECCGIILLDVARWSYKVVFDVAFVVLGARIGLVMNDVLSFLL